MSNGNARFIATVYNDLQEDTLCYPILSGINKGIGLRKTRNTDIIDLLINKMPKPASNTPWEKIIEFKSKHEHILYKLRLENWISDISRSNISLKEIEQKIEYYLKEYEYRLKLEKIKYNYGTVGFVLIETVKFMEDLIKLNWSKRLETILNYQKRNVELLIGETKSTGKEIAYISVIKKAVRKSEL